MHLKDIHNLFEFNYWAKKRILGIVETVTPDQYMKDMGSSHGGIHGTLVHMMGAEEIWLKRWKGTSPSSFYSPSEFTGFESVKNRWATLETEMLEFCRSLTTEGDIQRMVDYKDLKGNSYAMPLWQLMHHLVNHSSYHRGQVVTMLRQAGVKPVGTDLVAYYREQQS